MMETKITSRKNPLIQQVRKLLSSKKEREQAGLFVADGTKLLHEAVRYYPGLETVLLTEAIQMELPEGVEVVRVSEEIMEYVSPMETPQGALFLCRLPEQKPWKVCGGMLLLDGIQDPGNLGTILRTADALDIPVALLEGCADPYNHKTVRASMGAVFRKQPIQSTWEQARDLCREAGVPIAVTALSPQAKDIREEKLSCLAVVIGSEGRGVRPEILEQADRELIIPMNAHCESLNAAIAAAIVMWQMKN